MQLYSLSQEELRKLQLIQLEMLCEVDRICKKCGINYNIIAGTLLGAVRHKGYIPWDDDADVALLRSDYECFREACKTELNHEKFYFQDHTNTEGYRWGYGKLRRRETLFLREHQEDMPYEQGIFIDVFPLDNVPDKKLMRNWINLRCFVLRKLMWAPVGVKVSKSVPQKFLYKLLSRVPTTYIYGRYDRLIEHCKRRETQWVRTLTFPAANKEYGYLRKWYENSEDILFENVYLKGMTYYDEYLSFKFGDYMKLPDEKDRKTHPVTALKLLD